MDLLNLDDKTLELVLYYRYMSEEKFKDMITRKEYGKYILDKRFEDRTKFNLNLIRSLLSQGAPVPPSLLRQLFLSQKPKNAGELQAMKELVRYLISYGAKPLDPAKFPNDPEDLMDDELYSIFVGEDLAGGRMRRYRRRRRIQGGFFSFLFN